VAPFLGHFVGLLDNSRIRQLADCQLADWTTRGRHRQLCVLSFRSFGGIRETASCPVALRSTSSSNSSSSNDGAAMLYQETTVRVKLICIQLLDNTQSKNGNIRCWAEQEPAVECRLSLIIISRATVTNWMLYLARRNVAAFVKRSGGRSDSIDATTELGLNAESGWYRIVAGTAYKVWTFSCSQPIRTASIH